VRAHRAAIGFQPAFRVDDRPRRRELPDDVLLLLLLEVAVHRTRAGLPRNSQGAPERSPAFGLLETSRIGVQPSPPTRHPATDVHDEHGFSRAITIDDHPQQG
jgi:hypothetical protein